MNCVSSGCHASETDILFEHDAEGGFDPYNTPILCANCHSDNALGMPGDPDLPSLSEAIHSKHGEYTNDCYLCHPGPNTQCFRDVMYSDGMVCQDCHGSVSEVGQSISDGRIPGSRNHLWSRKFATDRVSLRSPVSCSGIQEGTEPLLQCLSWFATCSPAYSE